MFLRDNEDESGCMYSSVPLRRGNRLQWLGKTVGGSERERENVRDELMHSILKTISEHLFPAIIEFDKRESRR